VYYYSDANTQMVGLPYKNDELVMWIMLPTNANGFDSWERSLTATGIKQAIDGAQVRRYINYKS
jgi:serine protease inhibitor